MAPPERGRPTLPETDRRKKVEVWLHPNEIEVLEQVAQEADVRRGVLLRSIVIDFCKAHR